MKAIKIFMAVLLALCVASCSESDFGSSCVREGLPAKLNLELTVPKADEVAVTRGLSDEESEVNELMLIMFSQTGRKMVVDLSDKLTEATTDSDGSRTYGLSGDISTDIDGKQILSGTYRVYAVANWSSNYAGLTKDGLKDKTEEELKALAATNTGKSISAASNFPMSSCTENVDLKPVTEDAAGSSISISLTRLTAHIEFIFKNGSNETTSNVSFTPRSYRVFHLPTTANLVSKDDNKLASSETFHLSEPVDVSTHSFDFFMLENVRDAGKDITAYHDRDAWDYNKSIDPKMFTHAPENSTYVVVTGEYDDSKYSGEVSYTIHLGNFSEDNKEDYTNFTVNRNEYHKYTITVNGVNSIAAEVEVNGTDKQPGAEGNLVEKKNSFVLDAHYETMMLKLSQAEINAIKADGATVQLCTPQTGMKSKSYSISTLATSDADYKWVQFQKPASSSRLDKFKGRTGGNGGTLNEGLAYLPDFAKAPMAYAVKDGDYYYVQAFVDEYVYDDLKLSQYVNVANRTFVLCPTFKVSADKQSSILTGCALEVKQRSIKTTYTLDDTTPIFGIETWNETGTGVTKPIRDNVADSKLDEFDGYANTVALYEAKKLLLSMTYPNRIPTYKGGGYYYVCGYYKVVSDNKATSHVWGDYSNEDLNGGNNFDRTGMMDAYTRNRDENGNGTIDEDEIKWYLPAIDQYMVLWFGQDCLTEDTRLFDEDNFNQTVSNTNTGWSKLWTSSKSSSAVYWPDQGFAVSAASQAGKNWLSNKQGIRCCRNLNTGKSTSQKPSLPYTVDSSNRIITVGNVSSKRTTKRTSFYTFHTERETQNRLPQKFEVYKEALKITLSNDVCNLNKSGNTNASVAEALKAAVQTAISDAKLSSKDGWRIPNQRELLLAWKSGLVTTKDSKADYVSCTWYTAYGQNPNKGMPFVLEDGNMCVQNELKSTIYVWLVRDVD